MPLNPRSPNPDSLDPRGPIPYPLDETFVQHLKAALHERDPKLFFPDAASELANAGDISALNRFLRLIPRMPDLYRHRHPSYLEALNEALRCIDQRLTQFECNWETDSATIIRWRFMRWVNGQLRYRVKDLFRQDARLRDKEPWSLDCSIGARGEAESTLALGDMIAPELAAKAALSSLDQIIETLQNQKVQRQGLLIELYIEQDPDSMLQGCHARKSTWLNCQSVAQKMFLRLQGGKVGKLAPEKKLSWRAFAEQLNVKEQTVHSHWKRRCLPLLKKIAKKIEQQSEGYTQTALDGSFPMDLLLSDGPDSTPDSHS